MIKIYYKIIKKIKSFWVKPLEPPSYEFKRSILKNCKDKYGLKIFVETGTFTGDTVEFFKNSFKKSIFYRIG